MTKKHKNLTKETYDQKHKTYNRNVKEDRYEGQQSSMEVSKPIIVTSGHPSKP